MTKHSHYHKDVSRLSSIDVYRVLDLFAVTDPCVQHAVKKLLCAGVRGSKPMTTDIQEAIDTLERWKAMRAEDEVMPADFGQQHTIEPASAIDDEGVKIQLVGQSGEMAAEVYAAIDLDALRKRAPDGATHYLPEQVELDFDACWYKRENDHWMATNAAGFESDGLELWVHDRDDVEIFEPLLIKL